MDTKINEQAFVEKFINCFAQLYDGNSVTTPRASNQSTYTDCEVILENEVVKILSHNGNVFGVEPPLFVELEVTHTEPGIKGDTATNVMKPATLETGATINVPLFINIGSVIKIDTRTGEYLGRAN